MKKRRRFIVTMVSVATMILGLCGCSSSTANTDAGVSDGTVSIQVCCEPASLDPAMDYAPGEFYTTPQLCDTLLNLTSDLELEPNICSEWEKTDNVTYVYKVRDDVTFSDGSAMTMEDVLFCLNRIKDPEVGSMVSWMFSSVDTIEQTGDWEFTVKLTHPDALFQYTMALPPGFIYSKAYCEKQGDKFGTADGGIVGSGPYVMDSWTAGSEIDMSLNENYWKGTDGIQVKKLKFKYISESASVVAAANSGEIDFVTLIDGSYIDQIKGFNLKTVEGTEDRALYFNCKREYTSDVNVRKALACCMDRNTFMKSIYSDRYTECTGLLFGEKLYPDDSWKEFASNYEYNYSYDVEKAKEYLSESAYPDGGFTITALVAANNDFEMKEAQIFQSCAKELNITVELKTVSDAELETVAFTADPDTGIRDYDVYVSGWISDYPDCLGYFDTLLASKNDIDGGVNLSQYNNEEFDKLLVDSSAVSTDEERSEILKEMANIVGEDCPMAPLGYNDSFFLLRDGVDYTFNGMDLWGFYLKNIKLD